MATPRIGVNQRLAGHLALVAAVLITAGLAFSPVYSDEVFVPSVVLASIGSVGLWALAAWKWSERSGLRMLLSFGGYLLVVANTALNTTTWLGLPTPTTITDLVSGLINGWDRLMTTDIPVAGTTSLLVVPPTLVWLAGYVTAEAAFQRRSTLLPLAPPLLLFGAGVFLSGADSGIGLSAAGAFVASALLLILARNLAPPPLVGKWDAPAPTTQASALVVDLEPDATADGSDDRQWFRRRQWALGLGAAAGLVIAGLLIGPVLPWASAKDPYDPRDLDASAETLDELSPLVILDELISTEPAELVFTARIDGVRQNYRLAVLDEFDGARWRSTARYVNAGAELPPDPLTDRDSERLRQHIEIESLPGPWLPAATRPAAVRASEDFQPKVDPDTATLIAPGGDANGREYDVDSEIVILTPDDLLEARTPTDRAALALTEVAEPVGEAPLVIYDEIRERALSLTSEATTPFEKATALANFFSGTNFVFDDEVAPGHSYGHLHHFILKSKRGSAEQFATAFAVMARMVGLPTRVVVGFVAPERPNDQGEYPITTTEAHAWPEVLFEGLGWYAFEPNPIRTSSAGADVAETEVELPERGDPGEGGGGDGSAAAAGDAEAAQDEGGLPPAVLYPLIGLAAVTAVVLAYVALLWAVRARRRRRRRTSGDSRDRVVGAYHEALDTLGRSGLRHTRTLTARELSALVYEQFGPDASGQFVPLGDTANEALFSDHVTPRTGPTEAWGHLEAMERAVGQTLPRRRRVAAVLDPRALVTKH